MIENTLPMDHLMRFDLSFQIQFLFQKRESLFFPMRKKGKNRGEAN